MEEVVSEIIFREISRWDGKSLFLKHSFKDGISTSATFSIL